MTGGVTLAPGFPPGDLPNPAGRMLLMAYELAFRKPYAGEPEVVDAGVTTTAAVRRIGQLEIRVELQASVPKPDETGPSISRVWAWIWHEGALVFDAWCSRASTGARLSHAQKCEAGEWMYHLRRAHEKDERS